MLGRSEQESLVYEEVELRALIILHQLRRIMCLPCPRGESLSRACIMGYAFQASWSSPR